MPPAVGAGGALGDEVAVFIDLENLAVGAGEDLPGEAEPIPYKALELLCRDYGNTSIRRAYADWSRPEFGRYQNNLAQNGITLIQVTRFGAQQKNAADILMAVDAMEALITPPAVGPFLPVAARAGARRARARAHSGPPPAPPPRARPPADRTPRARRRKAAPTQAMGPCPAVRAHRPVGGRSPRGGRQRRFSPVVGRGGPPPI